MNDFVLVFLGDDLIPVTVWDEGTVDIHVPNLNELYVAMGITYFEGIRSSKGHLLGAYLPTIVKKPWIGQKLHLKIGNQTSFPQTVHAVYSNGNPEQKYRLLSLLKSYDGDISNTRFFTSLGENHIYLQIIKFVLNAFYTNGSTSMSKQTLLERAKTDESLPIKDIRLFLEDLINARIFKDEKDRISPEPALYYILMQAVNRMHVMSDKPFPSSN